MNSTTSTDNALSRRSLLFNTAAALFVGSNLPAKAQEEDPLQLFEDFERLRNQPIVIRSATHFLDPNYTEFAITAGPIYRKWAEKEVTLNDTEVEKDARTVWDAYHRLIASSERSTFNWNDFAKIHAFNIPSLYGSQGIFCIEESKVVSLSSGEPKVLPVLSFIEIEKVHRDLAILWGESFPRTVAFLGKAPAFGSPNNTFDFPGENGSDLGITAFRTAFIEPITVAEKPPILGTTDITVSKQEWEGLKASHNKQKDARRLGFSKIASLLDETPMTIAEVYNLVISHETGHLYDAQFDVFKSLKGISWEEPLVSLAAHKEINGFLAELRLSKRSEQTVMNIYQEVLADTPNDIYQHWRAKRWIFDHMMSTVAKDPEHYGIAIDPDLVRTGIKVEDQVTAQFVTVLINREKFNALIESLHTEHARTWQNEDLSDLVSLYKGHPLRNAVDASLGKFILTSGIVLSGAFLVFQAYCRRRDLNKQKVNEDK